MSITNETLLPTTTYGIPSGNYDGVSTFFVGTPIPAANYYNGQGSAQTAIVQTTNFVGEIKIQGTLNDWTQEALWFDISTYGNISAATTDTAAINMMGNFVWIRAQVSGFTAGIINSANLVF